MYPIQRLSGDLLADVLRRQPPSAARTGLAWQIAVGPTLARVTAVSLRHGVLTVQSPDARWSGEIERARDVVLARLQHLLGPDGVRTLRIER
jgi:predicted nucleic acid-binding Zn ribbon protein